MSQPATILPAGTRLVHVGPPKTGTTAVQAAFHLTRSRSLAQGVRYAGARRHSGDAVRAVLARPSYQYRGRIPPIRLWNDLVTEATTAEEPRVVISSEYFASASDEQVRRIVADLDPSRIHVAVTLRPLARMLSSQWQQNIRDGMVIPFDDWLHEVLQDGNSAPAFWQEHRDDEIIARWAAAAGPTNVTVIVLDERDRSMMLHAFEHLLGLAPDTLLADEPVVNRSLSLAEAEAIRALNREWQAAGLDWVRHSKLVHLGAAKALWRRARDPEEPAIEAPQWALDRATEIEREMVAAISTLGVRVVGDLDSLARRPISRLGDNPVPLRVSPELAAAMTMGALSAGRAIDEEPAPMARPKRHRGRYDRLLPKGTVRRRVVGRLKRRLRGPRRPSSPPGSA